MGKVNLTALIRALKSGVTTIVFTKIDTGEERRMLCTLNLDMSEGIQIHNISDKCDSIVVWCLDKKATRDVRVNTISNWYAGEDA
tara:strand:- start:41 stop:295 length:255 start_codon:yes stop_codon:yes gene_type:complete